MHAHDAHTGHCSCIPPPAAPLPLNHKFPSNKSPPSQLLLINGPPSLILAAA